MTLDASTAPVISSPRRQVAPGVEPTNPFALPPLVPRIGDAFGREEDSPAMEFRRVLSVLGGLSVLLAPAGLVAGALVLD